MNAIGTKHDMAHDALVAHYADGCCTPTSHCADAAPLLEILGASDVTGPTGTEAQVQNPGSGRSPQAGSAQANQYGTFAVHHASPAQVRYLQNLLAQRDIEAATPAQRAAIEGARAGIADGTINKKRASLVLDFLLVLPVREDVAPTANGASEKQAALIERLWNEKDHRLPESAKAAALADRRVASSLIDTLFQSPKAVAEVALESGIYAVDGQVFKVYWNQGKTHMLAKELVVGDDAKGHWSYAGLASRFVKPEQRMTLAEAKEFGAIYGVCCNCGATLTDETSIEEGIGPVCGKRFAQ